MKNKRNVIIVAVVLVILSILAFGLKWLLDDEVSIEIKDRTLTKQGATIVMKNKKSSEIYYGDWYRIDKKYGDEWIEAEKEETENREALIFNLFAYVIEGKSSKEEKVDWSNLYGTLDEGEYRLVKEIEGEYIAVEFTI